MKSISVLIVTLLIVIGTNSAYNKQWSYTLNRLSRITHQTKDQIQTWNCKLCRQGQKLTNTAYIQNNITDVVGYAGYLPSKNNILVLMRGTVDVKNWIEDFSFYLVNYQQCKGCLIHEGFYLDYLSVSTQVISIVKGMIDKYPTARIVVIGSSLGAALATVAAIQLQLHFGNVDEIHNFGSPRVGNANFAQFLRIKIKQIYRVIHNRDIVPHVPFQSQNFHHTPFEILYDQNMENYKICDESGEDPTCSNSYNPNFSIPDHTSYWF